MAPKVMKRPSSDVKGASRESVAKRPAIAVKRKRLVARPATSAQKPPEKHAKVLMLKDVPEKQGVQNESFDGVWVPEDRVMMGGTIAGATFTWESGEVVDLDLSKPRQIGMLCSDRRHTATLGRDGALKWSDGSRWHRLTQLGGRPAQPMLKNNPEISSTQVAVVKVIRGVAVPTAEWCIVPKGVACPPGCEYRMCVSSGVNMIRLVS
eukprot:TRINITY_DN55174_c0_g1_i1.p1 TRINITY_DN55174_c0_g1~~TRINITY_DN55174_c0_g1_i1.p1  ORF type:complete len:228 (-),score=26.14 TRINITY_DN55174_c0_g1_i1:128-751(-)